MTRPDLALSTPRGPRLLAWALVATISLVALDLWTKDWAQTELSFERPGEQPPVCAPDDAGYRYTQRVGTPALVIVEGYLELKYAENCGAAFGLLRQAPNYVRHAVFGLAAIAASLVLSWMFAQGRGGPLFAWSVPLIVSGAIGNLVDRARLGYVVDFIRFHLQDGFEWPTFNVADCGITIGVALLVLDGFLDGRRVESEAGKGTTATEAG